MTQQNSIATIYGAVQEMQKLREKARKLSEKNVELAKALTATKQELTKARIAQNAVFSKKVLKWMEASSKNVEVQHQAIQCNLGELNESSCAVMENRQLESSPPLLPRYCKKVAENVHLMQEETASSCEHERSKTQQHEIAVKNAATNGGVSPKRDAGYLTYTENTSANVTYSQVERHHVTSLSPVHFCSDLERRNPKTEVMKRLRRRDACVSYVEPKLNTKLRRGDYYGLGKRMVLSTRDEKKKCARVESRRKSSTFGPGSVGQQFSPLRRRRAIRPVSYVEPKLNTKLRQGDKFTFTT